MAEQQKQQQQPTKRRISNDDENVHSIVQMLQGHDNNEKNMKRIIRILAGVLFLAVATMAVGSYFFVKTINDMYSTYIKETEKIIKTRSQIDLANQWERLPVNQRKERLRDQFFEIVRYYTNDVPDEQKMNDEQILNTFNQLWLCTERLPHVNFFLPVAYMKVKTNFNPVYNTEYQYGIAGFYLKEAERMSQLPLIKEDDIFKTTYKGSTTLNNPQQAIKLLIARIDDLMHTFNNREDWVILSLFENEYNVIEQHWHGGEGIIPDKLYESSDLAKTLQYYHSFKNWKIPSTLTSNE